MTSWANDTIRVATFNVSMEATQYVETDDASNKTLVDVLSGSIHPQVANIAEIIQRVRPDIVLLNEFDFTRSPDKAVTLFRNKYLKVAHNGASPIDYPYWYVAPVNTGIDSGMDLDRSGEASGKGADALGFGFFPGHYGMVVMSRYPIAESSVRTFQHFKWKDMPDNLMETIVTEEGESWYSDKAKAHFTFVF